MNTAARLGVGRSIRRLARLQLWAGFWASSENDIENETQDLFANAQKRLKVDVKCNAETVTCKLISSPLFDGESSDDDDVLSSIWGKARIISSVGKKDNADVDDEEPDDDREVQQEGKETIAELISTFCVQTRRGFGRRRSFFQEGFGRDGHSRTNHSTRRTNCQEVQ